MAKNILNLLQKRREITLPKELADQLDFYASKLNFKNNTSGYNKRLALVEHCINLRIDKELADSKIDKFILPENRSQDIFNPLTSFEGGKIETKKEPVINAKEIPDHILKMVRDIEAYKMWPYTRKSISDHPPATPIKEFEGISLKLQIEPRIWGPTLSEQSHQNLYRYCLKNGLDMDEVILKWLSDYLSKLLTEADSKRISTINQAITEAWEVIKKEQLRKSKPAWDLE